MTADMLRIPEATVKMWKKSEWWAELHKELKTQENLQLSNKLQKLVEKSMALIEDRLEHGDFIYDQKKGKLIRKPMSGKDVHKIMIDTIDRRQSLDVTERAVVAEENIASKLEQLAKNFEAFANKAESKPPVVVTDVVYIEENKEE